MNEVRSCFSVESHHLLIDLAALNILIFVAPIFKPELKTAIILVVALACGLQIPKLEGQGRSGTSQHLVALGSVQPQQHTEE